MEAADSSSTSSKVIVQCTDPYDLLEKLTPGLESRLPLGNLHWKSPTRPLRSIDKLSVSFVREAKTQDAASTVRRHQIPGLRQTPYVKVYLLRCDDRDNYKDTARKEIREWFKKQGIAPEGKATAKGQERHDAFEYIIVHVVLPGTAAASLPKSSKQIPPDAADSTDSVNSKSKWAGKNSTTVFDKLKADFANSSKAPLERVAQIRLSDSVTKTTSGTASEMEELWQEFVEKLKIAILQSFDVRVAQYEDDLRDKDSQRTLPGWNFCTFFILKEGLARGFENVGLVEDALTVYDELDADLDRIVQGHPTQRDTDLAGALLPFSQDLKPAIRAALNATENEHKNGHEIQVVDDLDALIDLEKQSFPLSTTKVDYQQRILTNQVSALDLRLYMYTRKLRLLFRKARNAMPAHKLKLGGPQYDIGKISEICGQALEFISFAARALRRDLYAAWGGQEGLSEDELHNQEYVIGNLVASWKMSAILQVLDECQISQLLSNQLVDPRPRRDQSSNAKPQSQPVLNKIIPKHFPAGPLSLMSPLDPRQSILTPLQPSPQPQREAPRVDSREGLALWTAELFVMLRDIVKDANPEAIKVVSLVHGVIPNRTQQAPNPSRKGAGIRSASLLAAHSSGDACHSLYKLLSIYAYQCYKFANQIQPSRQMILSLAHTEFDDGKPQEALNWVEKIIDLLEIEAKTLTDLSILRLYIRCLDPAEKPDEYVRSLLEILRFATGSLGALAVSRAAINLQGILDELVKFSRDIQPYEIPFQSLFQIGEIDSSVRHFEDEDGFNLSVIAALRLQLTLQCENNMTLILTSLGSASPQTIDMVSESPSLLDADNRSIRFTSNVTTHGLYEPSSLRVSIGNLQFVHSFKPPASVVERTSHILPPSSSRIMVFPRYGAIDAVTNGSRISDLTESPSLSVRFRAGADMVEEADIRLKPASGGFRLNVKSATLQTSKVLKRFNIVPKDNVYILRIEGLEAYQAAIIDIPYSVENTATPSVQLKTEIMYKIKGVDFIAYFNESIATVLPITVNVQDIFQAKSTFLRFTAGPATTSPLRVFRWQVEGGDSHRIVTSTMADKTVDAFPKMPANWVVQLLLPGAEVREQQKLYLTVDYECINEVVMETFKSTLVEALRNSPIPHLSRLFVPHLHEQIQKMWPGQNAEAVSLLRRVELPGLAEMHWYEVLRTLGHKDRAEALQWLTQWHEINSSIELPLETDCRRSLRLAVDVPRPKILVLTQLQVIPKADTDFYTLGQPIRASLHIQCSCLVETKVELWFEINAQADTWLIGGKRRGTLASSQDGYVLAVLLIPQRVGHLMLPSIDIRVRASGTEEPPPGLTCEVSHQSQAESVRVIANTWTVTTAIGDGIVGNEYWVSESRQRGKIT